MRVVVIRPGHHLAAAEHVHQHAGALQRLHGTGGADALFKAAAGLGAHAQLAGGDAVVGAVEGRGLEQHARRAFDDLRFLAAHDAGQAGGVFVVGDDQHRIVQHVLLAVQRGQLFALPRAAHDDGLVAHLGKVEGVHGLARLQHDEVGDVDDVVDGPHARAVEVFAHPLRRGADLYFINDAGAVAGAVLGIFDDDGGVVLKRALAVLLDGDLRHHAMLAKHGGALAGDAPDAQAVRAVGENFIIDDVVAKAEHFLHIRAGLVLLLKDEDALVADVRIQPFRHVQFRAGADHALALHAAQLAALDLAARQARAFQRHRHQLARGHVRRAADDLQGGLAAHVHRAYVQMVAVGVVFAGKHAAHHHAVKLFAGLVHALHGGAGHDHAGGVFLRRHVDVHIFPQPFHGNFHRFALLSGTAPGSAGRFRTSAAGWGCCT